ncbi:MAG TPA: Gfo/Idh/MocA family oxidoreductase [Polyangiaceae bacterium]
MKMIKPLRWGILGTGWVAQRFMADLNCGHVGKLQAVASRTQSRAAEIGSRYSAVKAHGSYEALFRDPDIDVVYVATEHHEHAEHCVAALENRKHVLCEKPFATSLSDAIRIVELARMNGVFCMEAMWSRFLPAMLEAKRLVDAGHIGAAQCLTANFGLPMTDTGDNRFFDAARGGGALLDRGVYGLSLAVWLFGRPSMVTGRATLNSKGSDMTCSAVLEFPGSRIAVIAASLDVLLENGATVSGDAGRIRLHEPFYRTQSISTRSVNRIPANLRSDLRASSPRERLRRLASMVEPYLPSDFLRARSQRFPIQGFGYSYEAAEVTRCVREGLMESPIMPLNDTLLVLDIIERLRPQFV